MTVTPYYSDPFAIVWDALARGGYGPRGKLHDFRCRCPGHNGDNPTALHVWDKRGDGSVWFTCHAHYCSNDEIIEPLGLRWPDLYPAGYYGDSKKRLTTARRSEFTGRAREAADLLLAASRLDEPWSVCLWLNRCPSCEFAYFLYSVGSQRESQATCPRGCDTQMVTKALAEQLGNYRGRAA